MTLSQIVMNRFDFHACLTDAGLHILGIIHLGITVCQRRKIQTRHRQT